MIFDRSRMKIFLKFNYFLFDLSGDADPFASAGLRHSLTILGSLEWHRNYDRIGDRRHSSSVWHGHQWSVPSATRVALAKHSHWCPISGHQCDKEYQICDPDSKCVYNIILSISVRSVRRSIMFVSSISSRIEGVGSHSREVGLIP